MKFTKENIFNEFPKYSGKVDVLDQDFKSVKDTYDIYDSLDGKDKADFDEFFSNFIKECNLTFDTDNKPGSSVPDTPATKSGKTYKVTGRKTVKSTRKGVMVGKGKAKRISTAKPKQAEEPKPKKTVNKTSTAKSDSAPKEQKAKKAGKNKVGESPKWLKTLQSFVKSFAGKTKDTWRVRAFVEDIQAYFSKKHGNATPNIDLIREIQDKLLPYANSDKKKVEIPAYADLVAKFKKAAKDKDFTVSNKVKKSDLKNAELSGFSTGFNNLSGFKIGLGK